MTTYFISDLHLSATAPEITDHFLRFLTEEAENAKALYILGDLFEVWIGDDNNDPYNQKIMDALAALHDAGTPVYFMHGNRDFLIGTQFFEKTGCTPLKDPTPIWLFDKQILLSHGDQLCTLDKKYQWFRRFVRHPRVQKIFLKLPIFWREKIAQFLRKSSSRKKRDGGYKFPRHYDVVTHEVYKWLREHHASILIHGHTHKPKIEEFILDGKTAKRIVLGDWEKTGIILACSKEGLELRSIL